MSVEAMRSLALLLVLLAFAALIVSPTRTAASSSGRLNLCDLTPRWVLDRTGADCFWPNGVIGRNRDEEAGCKPRYLFTNMYWVKPPRNSTAYTMRSAGTPIAQRASDPTSYVPGEWTPLYLETDSADTRWAGLLLYATTQGNLTMRLDKDPLQNHVGSWAIPAGAPYQIVPACQNTVSHVGAVRKPQRQIFYWKGSKGLGKVTFRVLLKVGTQGQGQFAYPDQELVLQEGVAPVPQVLPTLCSAASNNSAAPSNSSTNTTITPRASQVVVQDPACFDGTAAALYKQTQAAPAVSALAVGAEGSSCSATCAQLPATPFCDSEALSAVQSAAALRTMVRGHVTCQLQVMAACKLVGPPSMDSSNNVCSFPSPNVQATCPPQLHSTILDNTDKADVCFTAVKSTAQPICSCTSHANKQARNPFENTNSGAFKSKSIATGSKAQGETSASSRQSSASFLSLLACVSVALMSCARSGSNQRAYMYTLVSVAMLLIGLSSVPSVRAHNPIVGLHRAAAASMVFPCPQRIGNQPHVQVIGNQTFEQEWLNGHGLISWFAVFPEAALANLTSIPDALAIFADYIAKAPPEANVAGYGDNMNGGKADGSQVNGALRGPQLGDKTITSSNNEWRNSQQETSKWFTNKEFISKGDPAYIEREAAYMAKRKGYDGTYRDLQSQMLYAHTKDDKRVSYASAEYPWLEAVHAFTIPFYGETENPPGNFVNRPSIARFAVPGRHGPGKYIVWYVWGGYSDCIDVDVREGDALKGDKGVENRYGLLPANATATTVVQKMHHCEFTYVVQAVTPTRKLDPATLDVSQCVSDCINLQQTRGHEACTAVQVVRGTRAPLPAPYPPNIPYSRFNAYTICGGATVAERVRAGCTAGMPNQQPVYANCNQTALEPYKEDELVCYGVLPEQVGITQVDEAYQIAVDSRDPVWYSSCYFIDQFGDGGFVDITPSSTTVVPGWQTPSDCVPCGFMADVSNQTAYSVPQWASAVSIGEAGVWGLQADTAGGCVQCDIYHSTASRDALLASLSGGGDATTHSDATVLGAYAKEERDAANASPKSSWFTTVRIAIIAAAVVFALILLLGAAIYVKRKRAMSQLTQTQSHRGEGAQMSPNPAVGSFHQMW